MDMLRRVDFTSLNQHPVVKPVIEMLRYPIVGYPRCLHIKDKAVCPHFYVPDEKFGIITSSPYTALRILKQYPCCIGIDRSVRPSMPRPVKEWQIFLNKFSTAWLQSYDITVYPNVVWAERIDYETCFEGLPEHSIVAVNSTGLRRDRHAKKVWRDGYEAMMDILHPLHIIRYGAYQEGEAASISTYFQNDNWRAANYGW